MGQESWSVLVVEDEANVRLVAASYLEDIGLTVFEADDADKALEIITAHPEINLVFTDIQMPGNLDGLSLIQQISVQHPKIEIIVTSGKAIVPDGEMPQYGTFVQKPYELNRIKAIIEAKLVANGFQ